MQNILFNEIYKQIKDNGIRCNKNLALVPDTNFENEDDYPVFIYKNKAVIMRIYTDDNAVIVSYVGMIGKFVVNMRSLKFLCWYKEIDAHAEYLI